MKGLLGRAAVAIWCDIAPEVEVEFTDWHTHEHIPERVGIPGFLRGTRWKALAGEGFFMLYEASRLGILTDGAYLARLNDPTPWSRKMMPHHRNMVRSLCRVRASFGAGLGRFIATVRFSPKRGKTKQISELLSDLPARKGLSGAHLLQSAPMEGPQTAEQKIRGGDAAADWVALVSGYDRDAIASVLEQELASPALAGAVAGTYALSYALTDRDVR